MNAYLSSAHLSKVKSPGTIRLDGKLSFINNPILFPCPLGEARPNVPFGTGGDPVYLDVPVLANDRRPLTGSLGMP